MSNLSSSRISETDWERVSAMTDAEIDLSDIPETTADQMARSTFRINRVPVERRQESVQLMIDSFVLDYFKAKAGDRDYRSLVNAALTEYMMSHPLEVKNDKLRKQNYFPISSILNSTFTILNS